LLLSICDISQKFGDKLIYPPEHGKKLYSYIPRIFLIPFFIELFKNICISFYWHQQMDLVVNNQLDFYKNSFMTGACFVKKDRENR